MISDFCLSNNLLYQTKTWLFKSQKPSLVIAELPTLQEGGLKKFKFEQNFWNNFTQWIIKLKS